MNTACGKDAAELESELDRAVERLARQAYGAGAALEIERMVAEDSEIDDASLKVATNRYAAQRFGLHWAARIFLDRYAEFEQPASEAIDRADNSGAAT